MHHAPPLGYQSNQEIPFSCQLGIAPATFFYSYSTLHLQTLTNACRKSSYKSYCTLTNTALGFRPCCWSCRSPCDSRKVDCSGSSRTHWRPIGGYRTSFSCLACRARPSSTPMVSCKVLTPSFCHRSHPKRRVRPDSPSIARSQLSAWQKKTSQSSAPPSSKNVA